MKADNKVQVLADLQRRILALELRPGQALDEAVLCQHYGLSRTPLREVLHRLAGAGYVTLESNRGASVSSMDLSVMRNFFQIAPMVYSAIGRLAAEHASQAQIEQLKKVQQRFARAVESSATLAMAEQNHAFHEQLGAMAASPYLEPSLARLLIDHTRMSHRFYQTGNVVSRSRVLEASSQHQQMIAAIENRAPAEVVRLTLEHWELSRQQMDKYVLPDSLPLDELLMHEGKS